MAAAEFLVRKNKQNAKKKRENESNNKIYPQYFYRIL